MKLDWNRFGRRLPGILASRWFWRIGLGLFTLEALWFAFSARYPMAFDENYHFGLIQLHATQWLPFFTHQPPDAGAYGAIVRDPSYLYHYLMSFPYRLLQLFSSNQAFLVIGLRLINVALVIGAFILYRRLLLRIRVSRAASQMLLLLIAFIPIVPFLAATINYDNLLLIVVPATLLLALRLMDGWKAGFWRTGTAVLLGALLLLGCLVKYPFLPVPAVLVPYLIWYAWRHGMLRHKALGAAWHRFRGLRRWAQLLAALLLLVSVGLFSERYLVNLVRYHTPVPQCDQVISEAACSQYGPWQRDNMLHAAKQPDVKPQPITYIGDWFYGLWYRLFFAVNWDYSSGSPLAVLSRVSALLGAAVLIGIGLRARSLLRRPELVLLVLVTLSYSLALFLDDFREYVMTNAPVAINGRYLLPFLPLILGLGGLAWSDILRRRQAIKADLALFVIVLFLVQGGGMVTFIARADDNWLWNNQAVRSVDHALYKVTTPLLIERDVRTKSP